MFVTLSRFKTIDHAPADPDELWTLVMDFA
jgi:hypothetical protein